MPSRKPTLKERQILDAIRDEEIDYSDIPEVSDRWFETARVVNKKQDQKDKGARAHP